tara:strand:- start:24 stop:1097 length:1074 start_codon:yes stop_codon:yes gene_type:complete
MEFDRDFIFSHQKVYNIHTNKSYNSKISLILSDETPQNLRLLLHDGQWDQYNWEIEPSESFDNLLINRCRQLRQMYPYLTLYFSGGADSETMVQSFIKAGIDPDEIVINVFEVANENPLPDVELAIKKLNIYKNYLQKTKITINRFGRELLLKLLDGNLWFDSYFNGSIGNIRRLTLPIYQELGFYKDFVHYTGHIFADMKPQVEVKNNKFYAKMGQGLSIGQYADWFYTSLDAPELQIKQAHLVKNYFKIHVPTATGYLGERSKYKEDVIKACRYKFDDRFQPDKFDGLGSDVLIKKKTEDSVVYNLMKSKDHQLFDTYTSKTKELLSGIKSKSLIRPDTYDLVPISYQQEFYLGE